MVAITHSFWTAIKSSAKVIILSRSNSLLFEFISIKSNPSNYDFDRSATCRETQRHCESISNGKLIDTSSWWSSRFQMITTCGSWLSPINFDWASLMSELTVSKFNATVRWNIPVIFRCCCYFLFIFFFLFCRCVSSVFLCIIFNRNRWTWLITQWPGKWLPSSRYLPAITSSFPRPVCRTARASSSWGYSPMSKATFGAS